MDLLDVSRMYEKFTFFYDFLHVLTVSVGIKPKSIVLFGNKFNNTLPGCIDKENEAFIGTIFLVGEFVIFYPKEGLQKMRLFPGILKNEKGMINLMQMKIEEGGGTRIRKIFRIKDIITFEGFYELYFETQLGYGRYFLSEYMMEKLRSLFC